MISVASPCKQSWEQMQGDANVRFCRVCSKNVYQLDNLSTQEVRELIIAKEGKLCWRFFVRRDGTVLTRDCPVGLKRIRQRMLATITMVCAMLLSSAAVILRGAGCWDSSQVVGSCATRLVTVAKLASPLTAIVDAPGPMMGAPPPRR